MFENEGLPCNGFIDLYCGLLEIHPCLKEAEEFRSVAANARQVAQARSRERVMQVRRGKGFCEREKVDVEPFFQIPGVFFYKLGMTNYYPVI